MSDGEIEVFEELSGVAFEPTEKAPGGLGSLLGSVSSVLGPALGGPGGMFGAGGFDFSSSAESRAISGGPFSSGDVVVGKSDTIIIAAVVVLGLLIIFWSK